MSGCESGSVDDWLSQLPEGKKDLVLNEEQRATLMVAASEGIVDPSCSWTFGYLVQKFHEERMMDVVEVVIKLAQEPTSNAVATNNADKEERGEDTRHDGLPVDDPMDIDDNVPGDHFGRENDPSQPLPSREEQPTIRVPPSVIDSGIQHEQPEPEARKRKGLKKKTPVSDSAAMKKKYQASSDDDEPSKKTLLQTQQTQDQEAQSQQSTPHSPFLFWAILFGCIILIVLGVLFVIVYKDRPEPETVLGHSKIMSQLLVIPKMNQLLEEWMEKSEDDSNSMSILVTGKTGVGKSTLINGIIGKRVIPVEDNVLKPATEDVEAYNLTIGEVEIKVWDTHGFQEGASGDETKYLEDMKWNCEKVDLVLYCLRMDDTRMRPGDTHAIKQLTSTFGKSIWDHALFVLTFANRVEPPKRKDRHKLEEYFNNTIEAWVDMLRIVLKETGVMLDTKTVSRKVVPAGYEEAHLPGRRFWLSDLWLSAFHESSSHAKPLLLAINNDRMTDEDEVVS